MANKQKKKKKQKIIILSCCCLRFFSCNCVCVWMGGWVVKRVGLLGPPYECLGFGVVGGRVKGVGIGGWKGGLVVHWVARGSGGWPNAKASVGRHNLRSVLLVDWLIREQICLPFFALVVGYAFAQLGRFKETSRSWLPFFVFKHFHFVCNLFELYLNFSLFGVVIGFLFFCNFGSWPISLGCCSMPSSQLFMLQGQLSTLYVV